MRSYYPLPGDVPLLRNGAARLAAQRLGMLVPPYYFGLEYLETRRQCNKAGGNCAYHYAGRGGTEHGCDTVITDYFISLDIGPTQLRGWTYAYVPAHLLDAARNPANSVALTGWLEFDLWLHNRGQRHVTRLSRQIRNGRIVMARPAGFNGRVPAGIMRFTEVTDHSDHYTLNHPTRDPWW